MRMYSLEWSRLFLKIVPCPPHYFCQSLPQQRRLQLNGSRWICSFWYLFSWAHLSLLLRINTKIRNMAPKVMSLLLKSGFIPIIWLVCLIIIYTHSKLLWPDKTSKIIYLDLYPFQFLMIFCVFLLDSVKPFSMETMMNCEKMMTNC